MIKVKKFLLVMMLFAITVSSVNCLPARILSSDSDSIDLTSDDDVRERVFVGNPLSLLDSMSKYLMQATTGIELESRNRLPRFVNFLFKVENEGNFIEDLELKINVEPRISRFISRFCGNFKDQTVEAIFSLLNESIFNAESLADAKKKFRGKFPISRRNKSGNKWVSRLVKHLFNLRNNENKRNIAVYFFIDFLSKVVLEFSGKVNRGEIPGMLPGSFCFGDYPFHLELAYQDQDSIKNDIFNLSLNSGYESTLHIINFENDKFKKYERLIRHIVYYLRRYQRLFFEGDNFDELFKLIRSSDYLISIFNRDINRDINDAHLMYSVYIQIKKKLKRFDFYPQSYFPLVETIYNFIKIFNLYDFLEDKFMVKDTHLKKLVLEPKQGAVGISVAPKGGHFDHVTPFTLHMVPSGLHGISEVFEAIDREIVTINEKTGIAFIDWIITRRPFVSGDMPSSPFAPSMFISTEEGSGSEVEEIEDIKYSTKSSTLFPDCYKNNFEEYIKKLYMVVVDSLKEDGVEMFRIESTQAEISSYVIKHKLSFACSPDDFINGEDPDSYIYVYFTMSKECGLNLINTIFPLGAFILDLSQTNLDEYFPIKYMSKVRVDDTNSEPEYEETEITREFVDDVYQQKIRNDASKKMIIVDRNGHEYYLIMIRHGIYVKAPL